MHFMWCLFLWPTAEFNCVPLLFSTSLWFWRAFVTTFDYCNKKINIFLLCTEIKRDYLCLLSCIPTLLWDLYYCTLKKKNFGKYKLKFFFFWKVQTQLFVQRNHMASLTKFIIKNLFGYILIFYILEMNYGTNLFVFSHR